MDHGTFKDLMEDAKGSDFKLRYLKQFYRKKLSEYEFRTGVPDGKFALPDKKIFEYKIQEIREKRRSEFEEWLGMKIEDINSSNMAHVMATLRKEIKIVNDERVVDFVRIIFFHSELKGRDKEELYAIIHNSNIPIYEGTYNFLNPIPVRGDKLEVEISDKEWIQRIENASANFIPGLIKKIID